MDEDSRSRELSRRISSDRSIEFSGAFSDCGSDVSGEFLANSRPPKSLLLSTTINSFSSNEIFGDLVARLKSETIEDRRTAAMEIRLLAKNSMENRITIARAGAIRPLISLISAADQQLQEHGVTAILNLSLCDENKDLIVAAGAIRALVGALRSGTSTTKENAACALLRLSQFDENKIAIGRSGAIPPLVNLLEKGTLRGKKDASTALYTLCSTKENKTRAVEAGIMKPLLELMSDPESGMVDKAIYVANSLVGLPKAKAALVEEEGIPVVVELLETGTKRQKEVAVSVLLQLCNESSAYRGMVAREGAIPPLLAFSQSGGSKSKQKADDLIRLLRQSREK